MDIIIEGIEEAFRLIFSRDREVFEVVFLSLRVSLVSLLIAGSAGIPLGIWMAKHRFVLKHFLMRLIYTLMGMPPVLCGLVVYIIFMRRGPLGSLKLNYTVTVMIVGGNIEGKTRVMTTYISQLKGMGEFERAVAVGILLLLISFAMNSVLYHFQKEKSHET